MQTSGKVQCEGIFPVPMSPREEGGFCKLSFLKLNTLLLQADSWNGLLHSPSVLVCAGYESFKPLAMEDSRRYGIETLSGQTSRNKTGELVLAFPQFFTG